MRRGCLAALRRRCTPLARDRSGVAMIEFAFMAPIILLLGVAGLEMSNLAVMNLRVSQAAMQIADNASRLGDRSALSSQRIYESDINDIFRGIEIQSGAQTDLYEHGRVILSSLERNSDDGQWIHWQRCMGKKVVDSSYGAEGTGETGTDFAGMGTAGSEIKASSGQAVMFVEIIYEYQPLVGGELVSDFVGSKLIRTTSAFNVRGSRDLSGIYQRTDPSPVRSCDKYEAF